MGGKKRQILLKMIRKNLIILQNIAALISAIKSKVERGKISLAHTAELGGKQMFCCNIITGIVNQTAFLLSVYRTIR